MLVEKELTKLGLHYLIVDLGSVEILEDITPEDHDQLKKNLLISGLELLDDNRNLLTEKIKTAIIEMVYNAEHIPVTKYSDFISKKLGYDYKYLSNTFSQVSGTNIQQFIILHKIEKVKELLLNRELNLTEIAFRLHYSSVSHLSYQFKRITGFSPSYFKTLETTRNNNVKNI